MQHSENNTLNANFAKYTFFANNFAQRQLEQLTVTILLYTCDMLRMSMSSEIMHNANQIPNSLVGLEYFRHHETIRRLEVLRESNSEQLVHFLLQK